MNEKNMSRRNALKTGGLLAAAASGGFAALFAGANDAFAAPGVGTRNHDSMDNVQTIVNLAATAETLASTAYYAALTQGSYSGIDNDAVTYFKFALSAELYHLNFLQLAGGRALVNEFYVPANFLSSTSVLTNTLIAAETAFIGAYLAATRRFAELGQPRLAATTAQHAASEAEHLTLARDVAGVVPNNNALPAPIYYNVSDAVPTLTPFLTGGEGFIGPVAFPGADAINSFLGDAQATPVPPFVAVF